MNELLTGYIGVIIACIGFGSNYLPAKKVDIRDGQLFNVCLASGVFLVGFCQWIVTGFYKFEPFAMLGGALWGLGNLAVPLILANCGLGPGQLTWGLAQILTGWATGKFGLFGKEKDIVADPGLNYAGVAMLMVSLCMFSMMKPARQDDSVCEATENRPSGLSLQRMEDRQASKAEQGVSGMNAPLRDPADAPSHGQPSSESAAQSTEAPRLAATGGSSNPGASHFSVGFVAALMAGMLFGSNFDPPTYLKQLGEADKQAGLEPRHSPNDMDYVISHFSGILIVTVVAFLVQKALRPSIYVGKQVIAPGVAAGLMWGIAQVAWFKANGSLSYVVSFPIIVGVPGVIAALWGCWLFGENRGMRNGLLLCCVVVLQGVAVTLIALSKGS
mmetsp:Transcript_59539/g.159519  ORF Transcript_59539/g.159519 Transcript_59539/m.159519 type:complete len:387 (-) Transcript_59539:116-1276(-)